MTNPVHQDGVVLTDCRGEAPGCLLSPAQRAGWMVQRSEKGQRPGHLWGGHSLGSNDRGVAPKDDL